MDLVLENLTGELNNIDMSLTSYLVKENSMLKGAS